MAKLPALPLVRAGLSQGLSANESYRQYEQLAREGGLQGTRRQDYLRLVSQTSRLRALAPDAVDLPRDVTPGTESIVTRDTVHARGYGQWVAIFQRTSGEADFISTPFLVKSSEPLTPAQAEARALDYLTQQPDQYNRVTLGVTYTGSELFSPVEGL